jgi:hypothetical protein
MRGNKAKVIVKVLPWIRLPFASYGILISVKNCCVNYQMMCVCCPAREPISLIFF